MSEILVNTIKKADGTGSITVPADTGTVLTTATAASSIPGYGNQITEVDQWRMDVNRTGNQEPINEAYLTRVLKIGTGMTISSGVWTFPSTGIWYMTWQANGETQAATDDARPRIETTVNGGTNWTTSAYAEVWLDLSGNNDRGGQTISLLFDVVDTSTHKVRFILESPQGNMYWKGSATSNICAATLMKLGDT